MVDHPEPTIELPANWFDYVDPEELAEFERVACAVPQFAGNDRVERLIQHAVRIRRPLKERYGENWHQRRAGDSW